LLSDRVCDAACESRRLDIDDHENHESRIKKMPTKDINFRHATEGGYEEAEKRRKGRDI